MGVNGKQKGASAERELCKLFSAWWGAENSFARTPGSGAFATRGKKLGRNDIALEADLVTPERCSLAIESKKREGWNPVQLFSFMDKKKPVAQWWDQTVRQASNGKVPLLVFGKNRTPWLAMLPATKDHQERLLSRRIGLNALVELADGAVSHVVVLPLALFFQEFHPDHFLSQTREPSEGEASVA